MFESKNSTLLGILIYCGCSHYVWYQIRAHIASCDSSPITKSQAVLSPPSLRVSRPLTPPGKARKDPCCLLYRYSNAPSRALSLFKFSISRILTLPEVPVPSPLRFVRARASLAALTDASQATGVTSGSLRPHYSIEARIGRRSLLLQDDVRRL